MHRQEKNRRDYVTWFLKRQKTQTRLIMLPIHGLLRGHLQGNTLLSVRVSFKYKLLLTLPTPKVISFCQQHIRAVWTGSILLADQLSFHLNIPKMIMNNTKNGRWTIPFKKFDRLRVNNDRGPYSLSANHWFSTIYLYFVHINIQWTCILFSKHLQQW